MASDELENTVMVRVIETYSITGIDFPNLDSKVIVSFSDGSVNEYSLKSNGIRYLEDNTKKIHQILDKYFTTQYELVSEMSTGGDNSNNYIWIFKEQK